ncbi:DUF2550 domain-containing protein [Gordonia shandongensis]|uniref:DUF2550 domain-containing protein n=1 Tax=Gordonia shandongensis TaxID=376351 RepID=UPI0012EB6C72|nr:DUF2550 domain-containing protein [Gordonia shandongensis]
MWAVFIVAIVVAALVITAGVVYRLSEIRRAGTPMLLRAVPADTDEGWRHGSVHYGDDALNYYRLRSLRPGPSVTLSRRRIEIVGRRTPVDTELEIMDGDFTVIEVAVGRSERSAHYELGMSPEVSTAFLSWIEARSLRRVRRRPAA